jgi:hypothetical protein
MAGTGVEPDEGPFGFYINPTRLESKRFWRTRYAERLQYSQIVFRQVDRLVLDRGSRLEIGEPIQRTAFSPREQTLSGSREIAEKIGFRKAMKIDHKVESSATDGKSEPNDLD